ncbi:MAG: ABC transporter ATP-binding protein [Rhodanobacteraceae bacterium]|nr:ABC transporter ATP-binding protein [Rhodanobacteraceae bacterium]
MTALVVRNLKKTYAGRVEALKGISLNVDEGDFFALLGPNGAGKSTLIGIAASLVRPSEGDVLIFGDSVVDRRSAAVSHIGLVPQEFNFNQFEKPFEILVNQAGYYGVPRALARSRAEQYLKQLSLWDKRDVASRTLSGGMKRRLMIARAMMHQPRLLILDEPTAGVDIEIRRSMWTYLREINRAGTTVILTTHYLEEAESLCRNVAIIDHGTIITHTTVKALLATLDVETFVFDLASALTTAPELPGCVVHRVDDTTIEVEVPRGTELNGLFAALTAAGIGVRSMRNKANRLEELFMRLLEKPPVAA